MFGLQCPGQTLTATTYPYFKESTKAGGRQMRPPSLVEAAGSAAAFMDGLVAAKEAAEATKTHANVCKISTCMHTRCAMLIPKRIMKGKSPNPHLCSAESCQIRSSLPVHNRVWPFTLCGSAWRPKMSFNSEFSKKFQTISDNFRTLW